MSFDQAIRLLSRDDRFRATISAMNTLLVQKGVYSQQEFEAYFCQWADASQKKRDANVQEQSASIAGI